MRVLVTGATGAVGPFVIAELQGQHQLRLFARRPLTAGHNVVVGDLLSLDDCRRALENIEGVVHLAAVAEPGPDTFAVNVQGTFHLLQVAREAGVKRFIFASSNCIYGHCYLQPNRAFEPAHLPISETQPARAEDNYGLSKALDERLLALYSKTWGLRTAALRLCWVWRAEEVCWRQTMTALDLARFAPYFWAYVDARDAARAFRLALEARALPLHGAYNITAADHMADEASAELAARFYPQTPGRSTLDDRRAFFDWQAAHDAFGYCPQHSWRDGWNQSESR